MTPEPDETLPVRRVPSTGQIVKREGVTAVEQRTGDPTAPAKHSGLAIVFDDNGYTLLRGCRSGNVEPIGFGINVTDIQWRFDLRCTNWRQLFWEDETQPLPAVPDDHLNADQTVRTITAIRDACNQLLNEDT